MTIPPKVKLTCKYDISSPCLFRHTAHVCITGGGHFGFSSRVSALSFPGTSLQVKWYSQIRDKQVPHILFYIECTLAPNLPTSGPCVGTSSLEGNCLICHKQLFTAFGAVHPSLGPKIDGFWPHSSGCLGPSAVHIDFIRRSILNLLWPASLHFRYSFNVISFCIHFHLALLRWPQRKLVRFWSISPCL